MELFVGKILTFLERVAVVQFGQKNAVETVQKDIKMMDVHVEEMLNHMQRIVMEEV